MEDLLKGGWIVKRQAVKGCIASEEWLSAGLEGFTKRAFAVGSGHPSGSVHSCSASPAASKAAWCRWVCGRLPGWTPASLMASSSSGQVSPRFLPLMLGWFHQRIAVSELSVSKSCAAAGCAPSWVPWWRVLIEEKRPVKFVMAGANQKRGFLQAGFLCRGRELSGEPGRVKREGRVFRGKLSVAPGHRFCSSTYQQQWKSVSHCCVMWLGKNCWRWELLLCFWIDAVLLFSACLPAPAWFFICWRKGVCNKGCLISRTVPGYCNVVLL